jgi:ASC-1-like (ASCH) protein
MEHSMTLVKSAYDKIVSGTKTIEIRLFDEKRQKLHIGDTLVFTQSSDTKNTVKVEVIALLRYKSFQDLVNDFSMEYFGYPKEYSRKIFVESMYAFYSPEQEKKYGVLGIKIQLL